MGKPDCIVIGGGLVGMVTARELALEGLSVALVERSRVGMESSWAGGGILASLSPGQDARTVKSLSRYSNRVYEGLCCELFGETGIDSQWQRCGMLILNHGGKEDVVAWANEGGLAYDILDQDQIREIEPGIVHQEQDAIWIPDIAQVRTPRLIQAMKSSLLRLGVSILEKTAVTGVHIRQDRFESITTTSGSMAAERAVIACGAWSAELLGLLGYQVALRPVRGQIICLKAPHPCFKRLLLRNGYYLIPRLDGHILIGSTVEDVGFDNQTTPEARNMLTVIAGQFSPDLEDYPLLYHWAGLRPATADGLPLICMVPGIEGLYLNTGHFRNGILQAPGSARLLVDSMLSRPSFMPADSFSCRDILTIPAAPV
jgi:glycine oxidase